MFSVHLLNGHLNFWSLKTFWEIIFYTFVRIINFATFQISILILKDKFKFSDFQY